MNCPNCGAPVNPGVSFCENCGVDLSVLAANNKQPTNVIPKAYKPITPWGYIGWSFLFSIPVVGFVLLIVFSFKKSNINRRNFARSYWCALLLLVILLAVTVIVGVATGYSEEVITMLQDMLNSLN